MVFISLSGLRELLTNFGVPVSVHVLPSSDRTQQRQHNSDVSPRHQHLGSRLTAHSSPLSNPNILEAAVFCNMYLS